MLAISVSRQTDSGRRQTHLARNIDVPSARCPGWVKGSETLETCTHSPNRQ